jgi:ATP-dependent Clp protease adapter protein ClpS
MSELIVKDGVDPWRDELGNLDQTAIAPVCRVRMFDDKVTSMEFVVSVLHKCCGLSLESAITGMFTIHNDGQLIVASLSELSAQRLVAHITEQARKRSYPLRCDIEAIVGQGRTPT